MTAAMPVVRVRGLVNRFGSQVVHDGLDLEVREGEYPTSAQINAFRELRAWLRGKGLGAAIRGHRDFISTSCPGSVLYGMVKNGALTGAPSHAAPNHQQEDDMPDYVSVGINQEQALPPNEWVTIEWGKEYSDKEHHHWNKGGSSFVVGPARYGFTANIRIDGLTPGTELQARVIEHAEDGSGYDGGPISEYTASEGATFVHYSLAADTVPKGRRARFQVIQYGTQAARITGGSAKAFVWPT